jgi:endonuclease G, mitochondrial
MHQTFYMTNILPQRHTMNAGAWRHTEEIIECYRSVEPLMVYGGPIWNERAEHIDSHDVDIPEKFWKVVIAQGLLSNVLYIYLAYSRQVGLTR